MKKSDIKKVALMGIASGLVLSGQVHADNASANPVTYGQFLAEGNACGGPGGCGSMNGKKNGNDQNGNDDMKANNGQFAKPKRSGMEMRNRKPADRGSSRYTEQNKQRESFKANFPEGK